VLECAVAADSEAIVSGDSDLLRLGNFRGIDIMKASDLIGRLEGRT
jgi:predicted nucleic acid-binding protein